MKTEKLSRIIAVLTAALAWCGCSEEKVPQAPVTEYGEKVDVSLEIDFRLEGKATKSAPVDEELVEDVNVFVVDEIGDVVNRGYYKSGVKMQIEAFDNMLYSVYAIANAGKQLEAQCAEDIEALEHTIPDISYIKSDEGAVLMSGKSEPQLLTSQASITVPLTRCVAKVCLRADYSQLNEDVEIEVKSVRLRNVPSSTTIFGTNKIISSLGSINGDAVYSPSLTDLSRGIEFFQFENMQGTLQPENTSQQQKQWPEGSRYSKICSYVELKASYSSPRKYGDILYRFYLGNDMLTNYDIKRNTQLNVVVSFINDGAVEENTWRVDNSEIMDLVTEIELSPASHTFTEIGATIGITATVYPDTAYEKTLEWSSSDEAVARVDENGNVTSAGKGTCYIFATSTDGTDVYDYCKIKVEIQEPEEPEPDVPVEPEEPAVIEVTGVSVIPDNLTLAPEGESTLQAEVTPSDATDKGIQWSSSDTGIASVDENGKVTAISEGECTIYATSTSKPEIKGECAVTVSEAEQKQILEFAELAVEMYDLQSRELTYVQEAEDAASITVSSSNEEVVKIVSESAAGIRIQAIAPGSATITAGSGGEVHTSCTITVEKLRIVPAASAVTMYNHFYEDIEYTVYPAWAAKEFTLQVSGSEGLLCGFEGIANRVIPQFGQNEALPANGTMTLVLQGREDVSADVEFTVKPMLALTSQMKINANLGNRDAVRDLGLDVHPRGDVKMEWTPADGTTYYGAPAQDDVEISVEENTITFPIPNSSNGLYQLVASVTGDDGYGSSGEEDARRYCNITIYETVYLVGISKTIDRNKVEGEQHTWKYENEIVAKWLSHPNSYMYPNGEVPLDLPFSYKGITYTDSHTGVTEEFIFTFTVGEYIEMALDWDTQLYNGTAPLYYLEYFSLEADGEPYIDGSPVTGEPYLYIYSRNFASGFSKDASPDWEKIFEIVYP